MHDSTAPEHRECFLCGSASLVVPAYYRPIEGEAGVVMGNVGFPDEPTLLVYVCFGCLTQEGGAGASIRDRIRRFAS